jgi:SpoIID/LytB domain protein
LKDRYLAVEKGLGTSMRRALLPIALACSACLPCAAAEAATVNVVKGAGFGHGIGMSQYGAYGYALQGTGYKDILAHYYEGTAMSTAPSRPVRVLLQPNDPYIRVSGATSVGGRPINPASTYVARASGAGVSVRRGGKLVAKFPGSVRFAAGGGDPVELLGPALNGVRDGRYRGAIEVVPGGGVTAINVIDLDPYVKGVVAGEMPSSWPQEALKVQAVAARTYGLATRKTTGAFDQYPDTRSQVYRGVTGESARSNAAVDATAGQILTYGGVPAVTYYHSTSGGHTEDVQYSFIGALAKPWLVGVDDPYDDQSPYHRWQVKFTTARLGAALGAKGRFKRLQVTKRGASPRVVSAKVIGTRGTTTISGPTIRARLGLRDSWLTIYSVSSSARGARSARPAAWGARVTPPLLAGTFQPTPRGGELRIERRVRHERWRTVKTVRVGRDGRYRSLIERAGVYRVRAGTVAGPAVRMP